MSRTFWVAVGAVGGIYAYRRGQRALDNAKERGFVGNVQVAAEAAASVSGGVARLVALATTPNNAVVVEYDSMAELPSDVQVTPMRRTELTRRRPNVPATAVRFEALDQAAIVDVREVRRTRRAQRVS